MAYSSELHDEGPREGSEQETEKERGRERRNCEPEKDEDFIIVYVMQCVKYIC